MDAWEITAGIFTTVLVVLNLYIAWRAVRVLRWLHKSRRMANAIWSLYKTTQAALVFAAGILAAIALVFLPLEQHVKTVIFYILWTAVTVFIAVGLRRVDKMLTDKRVDPAAPVQE